MIPEVKTLFERSNNGRKSLMDTLPPGRRIHDDKAKQPSKIEEWSQYAVLLVEHSNDDGKFQHKSLRIQSRFLKERLRKIIKHHPGENFDTDILALHLPVKSFFHYLQEIKDEENSILKNASQDDLSQLRCLISWVENEYRDTLLELINLESGGAITYDLLWTIFKPGELFYTVIRDQPRMLKIDETRYNEEIVKRFDIRGWYIDTDGKNLGRCDYTVSINQFHGSNLIANLDAVPLYLHPQKDAITKKLSERGKRFYRLRGQHHLVYKGIALKNVQGRELLFEVRKDIEYGYVQGRIIVDGVTFGRFNPNHRIRIKTDDRDFKSCEDDDRYVLCSSTVCGIALKEKQWFHLFIDYIDSVVYDELALNKLVLHDTQKDLLKAMINDHIKGENPFDDIITGKGKGLITVLHGPPGVGKTLAVESVAEHTKRPVYFASSGDLGTNPEQVDTNLGTILDCVGAWNAILLLDEADVFLEQRATHDLTRNALVSIFLRRLEYFQGIMFLTTNRVTTFDHAFQSRIHLALRLSELSRDSRLKIWKNFLSKPSDSGKSPFDAIKDHHHRQLARRKLNGRQIKNAVRMAQILALDNGGKVQIEDIHKVLDLQEDFNKDSSTGGLVSQLQTILMLALHTTVVCSILYFVLY